VAGMPNKKAKKKKESIEKDLKGDRNLERTNLKILLDTSIVQKRM
jgi:hypothetical protein